MNKNILLCALPLLFCGCYAEVVQKPQPPGGIVVGDDISGEPALALAYDPASGRSYFSWAALRGAPGPGFTVATAGPSGKMEGLWRTRTAPGAKTPVQFEPLLTLSSSTLYGRWIENSSGTLSVKAAVYDTRGLKAPEEITVSGLLSRVLSQGSMVPSGSGSAFLAWEDFNPQLKTPFTAIAETGPGGLRWKKVLGNNAAGAEYMAPAITGDGAGGVFAAARHIHNGDKGIVLNHFSQRGAALAEDVQANTFLGYQSGPVISPDGQGGVFLIWEDGRSGDIDIYGQRISSGGIPAWAAAGVPIVTADGNQWSPVLAPDGAGGFFCAWIDDDMGMKWQLKVQRLDKDGRPLWGQAGLTVYPSDRRQSDLSMAADGKGGVILSWNEPRSGYLAVFAQRFATDGSRLWQEGGVPVAEDNWDQAAPIMAPDGKGGCLLAWKSRRSDLTWAVSAQRLDSKGAPLWKAGTERR